MVMKMTLRKAHMMEKCYVFEKALMLQIEKDYMMVKHLQYKWVLYLAALI